MVTLTATPGAPSNASLSGACTAAGGPEGQAVSCSVSVTQARSVTATFTAHVGAWSIVSSPNANTSQNNDLNGVACVSADECWAVGDYFSGSVTQTLIEKWDGTSWATVSSPDSSRFRRIWPIT